MSSVGSTSLSSSISSIKKNSVNNYVHYQNKLYNKEINNLINKIIKSKNSAFHFSKISPSSNPGPYDNPQNFSPNEVHRTSKANNNLKKSTKNNLNKSNNSSLNEASSISLVGNNNLNLKMMDFSKSINYFLLKKNDLNISKEDELKRSLLIKDLLNFIKMEKNLSNIINEQDQFISDFIEFISLINFSIKKENWQDILNLYDIFIELLNNLPTTPILITKLPLEFISNLVFSLQTLDTEERILIKMIIYKIYVSSLTYRKFILKNISNMLIDITNDNKTNLLCLDECLDLLRCIILGAKKPINAKYMYVVSNVICPLLKCKNINKQTNLKETLFKFMEYDKNLLNEIIKFLLRTWPVRYPDRVIIYLDIIENIFTKNLFNLDERLLDNIFKKINFCLSDLNFLIADRCIVFFKNDNFITYLYKFNIYMKFIKKLINNLESHWSQEIKIISKIVINKLIKKDENILKNLSEKDKEIFNSFNYDVNDTEEIWDIHFNLKGD